MDTKIIDVSRFTGQSYGYRGKPIIITFHQENDLVHPYNESTKYGKYHLNFNNIEYLCKVHRDYLPKKDDAYYKGLVVDWGYDFEEGLCKLMSTDKMLELPWIEGVKFKWHGAPWMAEEHRKIKRRLLKRQWTYPD